MPSNSLIPKELSSTRVTVSLGLIVAIAFGAFQLGSNRSEADKEQDDRLSRFELVLERQTTILEHLQREQQGMRDDMADVSDITSQMRGELSSIDSRLREK